MLLRVICTYLLLCLPFLGAASAGESFIRYRTPDGQVGFTQDPGSVPPGAAIIREAPPSKGSVTRQQRDPQVVRREWEDRSLRYAPDVDPNTGLNRDARSDPQRAPDRYRSRLDDARKKLAEAQKRRDEVERNGRKCRHIAGDVVCEGPDLFELRDRADKVERSVSSELEEIETECMRDPSCSPADLMD